MHAICVYCGGPWCTCFDTDEEYEAMRKRDELADSASCLNKAGDDEMLFVLLGRDRSAPVAVRFWIEDRIKSGKNQRTDPQIVEAEQWIAKVEEEQSRSAT